MKKDVLDWFYSAGFVDLNVYVVHSGKTNKRNRQILNNFEKNRQGLSLLFSVDMLSEGLHIKNVDGAIFLRKTGSYVVCLQQLGRTLKAGEKKQPIVLDLVNNINNAISYQVAVGNVDFPKDQFPKSTFSDNLLDFSISDKIVHNIYEYINEIETLWKTSYIKWENNFEDYKEAIKYNRVIEQYSDLGLWIKKQRYYYRTNKLSQEQIDKLNSIGFEWNPKGDLMLLWINTYNELKEYLIQNDGKEPKYNSALYKWNYRQRALFRENKLSQEQIDKLNSIGFEWNLQGKKKAGIRWEENYNELKEYLIQNDGKEPKFRSHLGVWCATQKNRYKTNTISQEEIDKLNSIGFEWGRTRLKKRNNIDVKRWEENYNELKEYLIQNDGMFPPTKRSPLRNWCDKQWYLYINKHLPDKMQTMLDDIKFYNYRNRTLVKWNLKYNELCKFIKNNGKIPLRKDNPQLWTWGFKQRALFRENKLSQEQIDKLNSIGFEWNLQGEKARNENS